MNSLELPIWIRPTGFKVYAYIFGCHLDEVEKDLKEYTSLGDFFYRRLKEGVRPTADTILVRYYDYDNLTTVHVTVENRLVPRMEQSCTSVRSKVDA